MSNDDKSSSHSRWNCKYHIVFTPKYRRKAIYGKLRKDIGMILRKICEIKEVEILEAHVMPEPIQNPTKDKCFKLYGLSKRKKCRFYPRKICEFEGQL